MHIPQNAIDLDSVEYKFTMKRRKFPEKIAFAISIPKLKAKPSGSLA